MKLLLSCRRLETSGEGFTRVDLVASVAILAVISLLSAAWLGAAEPDSKRAGCYNNLRRIGIAMQLWQDEHTGAHPWNTDVQDGGTRQAGYKAEAAWTEFTCLSNFTAPGILACPADPVVKIAQTWTEGVNGFANSGLRGNALSYFVGLHADPTTPRSPVAADRDISNPDTSTTICSVTRSSGIRLVRYDRPQNPTWASTLHVGSGQVLFADGSVSTTLSSDLRDALVTELVDAASTHIAPAR